MHIKTNELRTLLVCAFRYALGRRSYAVDEVAELLERYWVALSPKEKTLIHTEIRDASMQNKAGMQMDLERWHQLLNHTTKS